MRSAVNMLFAAAIGRNRLTGEDVRTVRKDERSTIFELVAALFKSRDDADLLALSYEVEDTPDTVEQWIEGNLEHLPDPVSRARGYACVSRADEYIGHTYRRQYYTLWRYATAVMLLGVSRAAGGHGIHGRIMPPSRWQKMGRSKRQKAIRTALTNKLSIMTHTPPETLREEFFTLLTLLVERDPARYVRELQLDADELNLFLQDRARSAKIVKDAAKEAKAAEKKPAKKRKANPEEPAEEETRQNPRGQSTLF
ncbi:MAG: hypothetical protein PHV57_01985 [Methanomicrobiaceae archaeon]|nr:hypothetical protein [Methanomicrobiaceae archaeon]